MKCCSYPDSKVHGANMGPTWVLSAPDGPHVGPMNIAIRVVMISAPMYPRQYMSTLEKTYEWKCMTMSRRDSNNTPCTYIIHWCYLDLDGTRRKASEICPREPHIWPVSLHKVKMSPKRKINRPCRISNQFGRWSEYISIPNFRPFLLLVLKKIPRNLKYDHFY